MIHGSSPQVRRFDWAPRHKFPLAKCRGESSIVGDSEVDWSHGDAGAAEAVL